MIKVLLISIIMILFLKSLKKIIKTTHWTKQIIECTKDIPGPKTFPFIGNMHHLGHSQESSWLSQRNLIKRYPDKMRLWIFDKVVIQLYNPNDVQKLLSSTKQISKGYLYQFLRPWLGEGLLISTGDKWRQRRKLLTPAFHFNILGEFLTRMKQHSRKLNENIEKYYCDKHINIVPILTQTSLEILCETTMGLNIDIKNEESILYKNNIYKIGKIFTNRMLVPWLHNDFMFNYLSILGKRFYKTLKILHRFTMNVILKRLNEVNKIDDENDKNDDHNDTFKKKRMAMLDLLINNYRNGEMDIDGIREEVDTFMFEGHDTTTAGLSFVMFCLANNPQCQEKVYEELIETFGEEKDLDDITIEDLSKLNYLEKCIKESMRLYPPVPVITRKLTEDFQFEDFCVPKSINVCIFIHDLHRNSKYWPEPNNFDPERFSPENCHTMHPFQYIPFSAGLRNCIGKKYVMMEMKIITLGIVKNYKIEKVDDHESLNFLADIVLRTKNGVKVKFIKRQNK